MHPHGCINVSQRYSGTSLDAGQYDLCWDEPSSSKVSSVPEINVLAAKPPAATAYDLCWDEEASPSMTDQYDMCWDDRPAAPAAGYQGEYRSFVSVPST